MSLNLTYEHLRESSPALRAIYDRFDAFEEAARKTLNGLDTRAMKEYDAIAKLEAARSAIKDVADMERKRIEAETEKRWRSFAPTQGVNVSDAAAAVEYLAGLSPDTLYDLLESNAELRGMAARHRELFGTVNAEGVHEIIDEYFRKHTEDLTQREEIIDALEASIDAAASRVFADEGYNIENARTVYASYVEVSG